MERSVNLSDVAASYTMFRTGVGAPGQKPSLDLAEAGTSGVNKQPSPAST